LSFIKIGFLKERYQTTLQPLRVRLVKAMAKRLSADSNHVRQQICSTSGGLPGRAIKVESTTYQQGAFYLVGICTIDNRKAENASCTPIAIAVIDKINFLMMLE